MDAKGKEVLDKLRNEFPTLTIEYKSSAISVYLLGYWTGIASQNDSGDWVINEDVRSILPNYVLFKSLESELKKDPSRRGAYLLVNSPNERFVYETFDPASRDKANHGFLGRIGQEESSDEVLVLSAIEKPENFDDLDGRIIEYTFSPHHGFHVNYSRRWLCVSLRLREGRGFVRELFLLDTGSPKSVMIRECAANLLPTTTSASGNPIFEIEGTRVEFELQDLNGGDTRTQNINLLGTNFLNHFVLIDDFASKSIMVLKRATCPRSPI